MNPFTEETLFMDAINFAKEQGGRLSPENFRNIHRALFCSRMLIDQPRSLRGHFLSCSWSSPNCEKGPFGCECVVYEVTLLRFKNLRAYYLRHNHSGEWCPGDVDCACNVALPQRLRLLAAKSGGQPSLEPEYKSAKEGLMQDGAQGVAPCEIQTSNGFDAPTLTEVTEGDGGYERGARYKAVIEHSLSRLGRDHSVDSGYDGHGSRGENGFGGDRQIKADDGRKEVKGPPKGGKTSLDARKFNSRTGGQQRWRRRAHSPKKPHGGYQPKEGQEGHKPVRQNGGDIKFVPTRVHEGAKAMRGQGGKALSDAKKAHSSRDTHSQGEHRYRWPGNLSPWTRAEGGSTSFFATLVGIHTVTVSVFGSHARRKRAALDKKQTPTEEQVTPTLQV